VQIHRDQESIGLVVIEGLDPLGVVFMVEQQDLLADQRDGRLIESSVEHDGAVFGDASASTDAKVVPEIMGGGSEALHVGGETSKGALCGGTVFALVIDVVEPQIDGLIEFWKGVASEAWQELGSEGAKEPLYLPTALGFVGSGMDQGDP
jgi:hypothetical protein